MYKCEYCGSMELVEKKWSPVNEQSSCTEEIIDEELMFCMDCAQYTKGIELPVIEYTYLVNVFEMQDGELVKLKEKMVFEIGANEKAFWYEAPFKFTEVSDDGHYLHFEKWIAKDVCQTVHIPCFPKLDLSDSADPVSEFFKGKPEIGVRVNELVDIVERDRVTGRTSVRIDNYREE